MDSLKKTTKIIGLIVYFLLFLLVSGKLFFEKQFDAFFISLASLRPEKSHNLTMGFAEPLVSLNPMVNDTGSRSRLLHIFEALVRVTPDLKIEPALAISYGALDELTWEFRLRPNVVFHNGQALTVDDVLASISRAKEDPESGVKDLASTIRAFQKIDEQRFQIHTESPDPLLLAKLSFFLIFPKDASFEGGAAPVGTGPYTVEKNEGGTVALLRFDRYWGSLPVFERVALKTILSKEEKKEVLKNRSVDILANMPADLATNFQFRGYRLQTLPSLEVNFLMFHFERGFRNRSLRQAVRLALNTTQLGRLAQGFSVPATQFVGDGIFGFDPSISLPDRDLVQARELVQEISKGAPVKVTLDLPKGLETFGANVVQQLNRIGIAVTARFHTPEELGRLITSRGSEFFFFGWRSELGDASDFLTAVVHSPSQGFGQFNGGNYRRGEVDQLIELSQATLKQDLRLEKLRTVMRKITVDDVIGIPLFSPEVLYGVSRKLQFKPRVDGYVLAQEVKL
jgi:peptide/nickel transport system substrate-binding protein